MNSSPKTETAIVVGAGVIGIACAHYLSKSGMQVTVIDRNTIAGACSHGNCGYICPSHVLPLTEPGAIRVALKSLFTPNAPFRVKPRLSPALWNWIWQFAKRCTQRQMLEAGKHLQSILDSSMLEYRRLIAEEQLDCEWTEKGLLYVLQTEKGMHEFSQTDKILSDHFGVKARRIEGTDLCTVDPALKDNLAGAFYYPGDASVRPDLLNTQWAERLKQRGVKFVENCELQNIGKSEGQITHLKTSKGEMDADRIIFATGAWSPQLSAELECHLPIQPGKGYSVTMQRPDPCPIYPMLFPEHKVGVSPFQNGYRLGSMMEFAGYDTAIPKRRINQLRVSAKPYLITPYTEGDQQTWFGWRPMTWDSLPIIGQVPNLTNAYLATGHNMLGMSMATATGKLIAEIIQQQPTHIDATPFSPTRF
ncbi:FAD-dependent oxidoreductase [uncultured Gimesia sp.]|uniref:NAD(P)/FAD-dependent oxidoreductase n=1 Tax=uncultured Gimesia sp. TaxID=1678688 RepID=UPI00262FB1F6|nr:FAD-dependent oxidoreductase [uncultured Gimesia sp.]